jgi:hypothetical protein
VVEYGDNIGTLKNLFGDLQQAVVFVKRIMNFTGNRYQMIGPYKWYCHEKQEYIKIEDGSAF